MKESTFGGIFPEKHKAAKNRESYTSQQWADYQQRELQKLLLHASENVAFYKKSFAGKGITAADIRNIDLATLRDLPVLVKDDLRKFGTTTLVSTLCKQYYQYGLYKPLVLKKVKTATNVRHLVPSLFVIYLATLPLFLIVGFTLSLVPLALYLIMAVAFAFISRKSFKEAALIPLVYFSLHLAYGLGFVAGLFLKPVDDQKGKLLVTDQRELTVNSIEKGSSFT
jgi:hypothetical protein